MARKQAYEEGALRRSRRTEESSVVGSRVGAGDGSGG